MVSVTEAAKPFSSEQPAVKQMTVKEYDLSELKRLVTSNLFGIALLSFLHLKFAFVQPLFFQAIVPLKTLWSNPLVQIHLRKKSATGAIARPFKAPNPFGDMFVAPPENGSADDEKALVGSSSEAETVTNESSPPVKQRLIPLKKKNISADMGTSALSKKTN